MRALIVWLVLNGGAVFVAGAFAVTAGYAARPGHLVFATLSGYLVLVHSLVLAAGLLGQLTTGRPRTAPLGGGRHGALARPARRAS